MPELLPPAAWEKNHRKAKWFIWIFSIVVFLSVVALGKIQIDYRPGFDIHIFALINASINSTVALLLITSFIAVRNHRYILHKRLMTAALILSVLFLISYVLHHLLAGESKFGDINHDGIVSPEELEAVGGWRNLYLTLLGLHILFASVMLPFILFTAYRSMTGEYFLHKKLARFAFPMWLFVAISGPVIYLMIRPYYT